MNLYIGTAGWPLPPQSRAKFPMDGSNLHKYSRIFNAVEITSAFYRHHKPETYARWAATVPDDFRFAVKLWREFTQEKRLRETGLAMDETLAGVTALGEKLGVLLLQLPPSLEFDRAVARRFFKGLQQRFHGKVAVEPRHTSWVDDTALGLLEDLGLSKVLADPERCQTPKAWRTRVETIRYIRLHGSPVTYRSEYPRSFLARVAESIRKPVCPASETWCMFDNTALGHGTENAYFLKGLLKDYWPATATSETTPGL